MGFGKFLLKISIILTFLHHEWLKISDIPFLLPNLNLGFLSNNSPNYVKNYLIIEINLLIFLYYLEITIHFIIHLTSFNLYFISKKVESHISFHTVMLLDHNNLLFYYVLISLSFLVPYIFKILKPIKIFIYS